MAQTVSVIVSAEDRARLAVIAGDRSRPLKRFVEEGGIWRGGVLGCAWPNRSSGHCGFGRRDELGELAEVLCGGGEEELIAGAAGAA